jgi:hypothetical protein
LLLEDVTDSRAEEGKIQDDLGKLVVQIVRRCSEKKKKWKPVKKDMTQVQQLPKSKDETMLLTKKYESIGLQPR